MSEVLFLSRRMYSEIQRTAAGQSSCRSRSRDLADSRTTNSSKYGTRYIRYQTNTIMRMVKKSTL